MSVKRSLIKNVANASDGQPRRSRNDRSIERTLQLIKSKDQTELELKHINGAKLATAHKTFMTGGLLPCHSSLSCSVIDKISRI